MVSLEVSAELACLVTMKESRRQLPRLVVLLQGSSEGSIGAGPLTGRLIRVKQRGDFQTTPPWFRMTADGYSSNVVLSWFPSAGDLGRARPIRGRHEDGLRREGGGWRAASVVK